MSHVPAGVQYSESILDLVGKTPLVRIRHLASGIKAPLLAKLEAFNPGGSVKDRIGLAMVDAALRDGRLKPGGTIIECTSGNTGMGLAMVAAVKGFKAIFCMPDKVSTEKVNLLKSFGAEVLLSPTSVAADSPESYYSVAQRLAEERPDAFWVDQYNNPANPQAHYESTGPELWEQTAGKITHFVAGMGTGGTISGTARYLREKKPDIQIIGADPVGSILKAYKETGKKIEAHPYKIEGVGEDLIPGATDFDMVDRILSCNDRDGLNMTRRLAREEAIFTGGSGGMAFWVALQAARELGSDDLMVVLLPDTGERYLSKVHNDAWMHDNHMLDMSDARVADVVRVKASSTPKLVTVEAGELLRGALVLVEQYNFTQVPVLRGKEVVGTLYDNEVLKQVLRDPSLLEKPVEDFMSDPLPVVPGDTPMPQLTHVLTSRDSAVLVSDNGTLTGILTRYDMLHFIAETEG